MTGGGVPKSMSRTPRAVRTMKRTDSVIPSATKDRIAILISGLSAGGLTYGLIQPFGDIISIPQNAPRFSSHTLPYVLTELNGTVLGGSPLPVLAKRLQKYRT